MIESIHIKNFKAIKDSGIIKPGDLTVFIGNNGTGKSSVLEALHTLQDAVERGLGPAMNEWGGMEKVRHYSARLSKAETTKAGFRRSYEPIEISLVCKLDKVRYEYEIHFNTTENEDKYVVEYEALKVGGKLYYSVQANQPGGKASVSYIPGYAIVGSENGDTGAVTANAAFGEEDYITQPLAAIRMPFRSVPFLNFAGFVLSWQFLNLNAHVMGLPTNQERTVQQVRLKPDGSNIAEYLNRLLAEDPETLDAIIDRMKFVLPYVADIKPQMASELDRKFFLEMKENQSSFSIPGWLFSTGTLRILALLAVFSQTEPPSVLFIDEVENGLDPRTIGLLLEEIRYYMGDDERQVFATTHSPYLLDLLDYRHIIVTEKEEGDTQFHLVGDDESLNVWKEKFTPGKLYTMGKLNA